MLSAMITLSEKDQPSEGRKKRILSAWKRRSLQAQQTWFHLLHSGAIVGFFGPANPTTDSYTG